LPLAAMGQAAWGRDVAVSNDIVVLRRLINLPADVTSAQWQTGPLAPHGGDWWLAAVLDVPADRLPALLADPAAPGTLTTPPGMVANASFAALKSVPGARPIAGDRLSVPGPLHGIEPFAMSPLLQGHALQVSATRLFVVLWTM